MTQSVGRACDGLWWWLVMAGCGWLWLVALSTGAFPNRRAFVVYLEAFEVSKISQNPTGGHSIMRRTKEDRTSAFGRRKKQEQTMAGWDGGGAEFHYTPTKTR